MDRLYLCNQERECAGIWPCQDHCFRTTQRRYARQSNKRVFLDNEDGVLIELNSPEAVRRDFMKKWGFDED